MPETRAPQPFSDSSPPKKSIARTVTIALGLYIPGTTVLNHNARPAQISPAINSPAAQCSAVRCRASPFFYYQYILKCVCAPNPSCSNAPRKIKVCQSSKHYQPADMTPLSFWPSNIKSSRIINITRQVI